MILSYTTTGIKDSIKPGVYVQNLKSNNLKHVFESHDKTNYFKLNLSNSGDNLAFVIDADSTKTYQRPYELYRWDSSINKAKLVLDKSKVHLTDIEYLLMVKLNFPKMKVNYILV
jgi:hypothetical protein